GEQEQTAAEEEEDEGPPKPKLTHYAGLNSFVWDMRYPSATPIPHSPLWAGSVEGPRALPGNYQVRLTVDGVSQTRPLVIEPDSRGARGPVRASPPDQRRARRGRQGRARHPRPARPAECAQGVEPGARAADRSGRRPDDRNRGGAGAAARARVGGRAQLPDQAQQHDRGAWGPGRRRRLSADGPGQPRVRADQGRGGSAAGGVGRAQGRRGRSAGKTALSGASDGLTRLNSGT